MIQIRKKLNSNAGASMILALALMLVCVVVSSIIVSTATSGISRNNKRIEQQQGYLAVSSAAELIAEELESAGNFTVKKENFIPACLEYTSKPLETFKVSQSGGGENTYTGYKLDAPLDSSAEMTFLLKSKDGVNYEETGCQSEMKTTISDEFGGSLKQLLETACSYVLEHGVAYDANVADVHSHVTDENRGVFYITVADDRLSKVRCEFAMDANYNITVRVALDASENDHFVTVTMQADDIIEREINDSGETTDTYCASEHKILNIYADGTAVEGVHTFKKTNDNSTIEISWHAPVITKGGQE